MRAETRTPVILLLCALAGTSSWARRGPSVEGDSFPFSIPDLQGNLVTDEDLRGRVLFVDLWGTWCSPCLTEIPTLNDLQDRYGEHGLAIVAIAFERDDQPAARRARLQRFVEEHGITYLVLDGGSTHDFGDVLPLMRDVHGFPVEILVDREGKVVETRNGYAYSRKWARRLEREIRQLLDLELE